MADNWGMVGHEWAVNLLRQHIQKGVVRHAYLICGPAGVGRRTLALRFIQALNCPNPLASGEPCRICHTCEQIDRMQYANLEILQPGVKGGSIKIGQLRDSGIQYKASLAPYQGRFRTALFLNFQAATSETQNALLKTLEEAQSRAIFILIAENPDQLLATIASRCEVLRLRPVTVDSVQAFLIEKGAEPEQAALLAHLSEGRVGTALSMFESEHLQDILQDRNERLDEILALLSASRLGRFNYAEKLCRPQKGSKNNKEDAELEQTKKSRNEDEHDKSDKTQTKTRDAVRQVMQLWTTWWRDVYFASLQANLPPIHLDRREQIQRLAKRLGSATALKLTEKMDHALELLDKNVNIRLLLEDVLLEWPVIKLTESGEQ